VSATQTPTQTPTQTQAQTQAQARAPYTLAQTRVEAGARALVRLPVARLPTGQLLDIPVHVLHGTRPGPTMFVSAALHGDELGGIASLRALLQILDPQTMSGTLLAVSVINGFGVINASRYLPDRRDLNRSFPGSKRGSLTARLAKLLLESVVARCEFGIDLHSGSAGRANLPQIRCNLEDPRTRALAEAFSGPLLLHARVRPGTLRGAGAKRGIPVLLHEGGEAHRLNRIPVQAAVDGVLRVMSSEGLWDGPAPTFAGTCRSAGRSRWLRATQSGLCEVLPQLGDEIEKGQPLARIYDPSTMVQRTVTSASTGLVIGVQRQALVYQGDALVHVALDDE